MNPIKPYSTADIINGRQCMEILHIASKTLFKCMRLRGDIPFHTYGKGRSKRVFYYRSEIGALLRPAHLNLPSNKNTHYEPANIETMTSLQIAEVTEKLHKDILKTIRKMEPAWEKVTERKFALSNYKDVTGRTLPMYQLNKTECLYIATKFNDEARARLVIRWEELERTRMTDGFRVPQSYAEALRQLADTVEAQHPMRKMTLQRHNTIPNPIKVIGSATIPTAYPCRVSTLARILQEYGIVIGRNQLFAWLRGNGYLHTHGEDYNLPTPKAEQMKLFEVKHTIIDKPDGNLAIASTVRITAAGQLYFVQQILGDKVS